MHDSGCYPYSIIGGSPLNAVARPENTLHEFLHAKIRDDEVIIAFYVRILNSLSLMLNSPHATPTCDANQLMVVSVMGISDQPLAHTHLVQTMDFHPRQQYMLYEPWDLVWADYQASTSPAGCRGIWSTFAVEMADATISDDTCAVCQYPLAPPIAVPVRLNGWGLGFRVVTLQGYKKRALDKTFTITEPFFCIF